MKLDRKYQLELLQMLSEAYPRSFDHRQLCRNMSDEQTERYAANMVYLEEHGLAESGIQYGIDGHCSVGLPRITARGMDFLADDGGLSAILNTVTIRFDDTTLRALLLEKIANSEEAPEDKQKMIDELQSLPAESIKHLTLKLLETGLERAPEAMQIIQTFLGSLL